MKNTFKLTIVLLALAAISCACQREDENHHSIIRLINKSEIPIYGYRGYSYPDTLAPRYANALSSQPYQYKVDPNMENTIALSVNRGFYEEYFGAETLISSDTLIVFLFDGKQLESNPSDANHINKAIIQYYYLSLADLKYLNWTLTYPPTPEMSVIKMYPPYKQKAQ